MICPICGKEFEKSEETCYILDGEYTCSWKCFYDAVSRLEKEKLQSQSKKGIPKKRKIYVWGFDKNQEK